MDRQDTDELLAMGRHLCPAQYQRLRARRGHSEVIIENWWLQSDHCRRPSIVTAAWHMLRTGELYNDPSGDYFTRQDSERLTRRLVRQLEALGHDVTLQPREAAA